MREVWNGGGYTAKTSQFIQLSSVPLREIKSRCLCWVRLVVYGNVRF